MGIQVAMTIVAGVALLWVGTRALSHSRRARTFGPLTRAQRRNLVLNGGINILGGLAVLAVAVKLLLGLRG
jgi:hypothetical protein